MQQFNVQSGGISSKVLAAFLAVATLAIASMSQYQLAFAADNALVSMTLTDTNANGQIDRIVVAIDNDSANTAAIHDTSGWAVTDGGNAVTISSVTFASATNADPLLINVDLDESDSDLTVDTLNADLEVSYTQQGVNAGTEYNDGADTQLLTISTGDTGAEAEVDGAAPVIKDFEYQDTDYDGMIDRFVATFSETVDATSVLSANDLSITDVSNFSGAAFGTDATDLITGSTTTATIDLGTESTRRDTNGSTAVISTQNAFSLTDGTNTNTTLAVQSQATLTDGAAPTVQSILYQDSSNSDGKVDRLWVLFTEPVAATSYMSSDNFSITDDGEFDGLAVASSALDLISVRTANAYISCDPSTVVDTRESSGTLEATLGGTFLLIDDYGNTNTETELAGALPTTVFDDDAVPAVKEVRYKDEDGNGKIDRVTLVFSEALSSASVLSANDLVFADVGDFTGATFGTDATDLLSAPVDRVDIDLGTEATVVDTSEDSGTININSQNSFSLQDYSGNVRAGTSYADNADSFVDYAAPVIASVSPADGATNVVRNAKIVVTFSEAMDTTFDYNTEFTTTNNPGGWSASWSSNNHVVSLSHALFNSSTSISPNLYDTEIDAAAGTPTGLLLTGPEDETWAFTTGTLTGNSGGGSDAPAEPKTYSLTVLTPNGGEAVNAGNQVEITWETGGTGNQAFVSIAYSIDGGVTYETFATAEKNDGSYMWTVPDVTSDQVRVRVIGTDLALALATDTSDDNFTIQGTEPLNDNQNDGDDDVVAPGTGEMGISPVTGLPEEISEVHAGDVIRGASFDTVYMVTDDLRRRPFLNEQIYFTWFSDFDNVITVTDATLRELLLGGPVLPQAGVVLMKLQTDARVYAIETHATDPDRAVKRLMPSEALAASLIGIDWADFVIDVPDTLFARFDEGPDITSADSFDRESMVKRMGL